MTVAIDSTLWTGLVMLVGTLVAMATRKMKLPAASGALVGGLLLGWISNPLGILRPDYGLTKNLLLAFVCFVLGAAIDMTALVKAGRRMIGAAVLQMATVTTGVTLVALVCGLSSQSALMVGLAFSASSPVTIAAVAAEVGARGSFTQRALILSALTLPISALLIYAITAPRMFMLHDLLLILLSGVVGLVMLVPLSRIETRGAMTACVALGTSLLALLTPGYPVTSLAVMAYLCGFMAVNLLPNREILRDALRSLALPGALLLFAGVAAFSDQLDLLTGIAAGLLLLAGRVVGLCVAGTLAFGRTEGLRHAAAQIPIAGLSCAGPIMLILVWAAAQPGIPPGSIFAALLFSELTGLIGGRWALRRAGESPLLENDPDSWRAAMS